MRLRDVRPVTGTLRRAHAMRPAVRRALTASLVTVLWLVPLAVAASWVTSHGAHPAGTATPSAAQLLARKTRTTVPRFSFGASGSHPVAVDTRLAASYAAHGGP